MRLENAISNFYREEQIPKKETGMGLEKIQREFDSEKGLGQIW